MALTRAEVVMAALQILDEYGLADLSMRRVAGHLSVAPGALYHHVENKQTLLAGIADAILARVQCPPGPWREAVAGWAASLREVLLAHRDSADLVASARAFGPVTVDVLGRPVLVLAAAGLPEPEARAAAATLLHFVLGHVAEEQARREWVRLAAAGAVAGQVPVTSDDQERFDAGVAMILDGAACRVG